MRTPVTDSFPPVVYTAAMRAVKRSAPGPPYSQRGRFVQAHDIDLRSRHRQARTISCPSQAPVDIRRRVPIEPTREVVQKYPAEGLVYHFRPDLSYAIGRGAQQ